jgi:ankyrin repeat protein
MNNDVNPICADGFTPLHIAAENGHLEICQLILRNMEKKMLKNPRNTSKTTPLHLGMLLC